MHHRHRQRPGRDRVRGERGAVLVEFALIAPILLVLLFGIVDFGIAMSNQVALRQGVREGARQGVVAEYGTTSSCGATITGGSENMRRLVCLTKDRTDLTASDVSVAVRFATTSAAPPPTTGTGTPPVGSALVVCGVVPLDSLSGMYDPILADRYLRSRTVMRVEVASDAEEAPASEVDPTGENWAWCTP